MNNLYNRIYTDYLYGRISELDDIQKERLKSILNLIIVTTQNENDTSNNLIVREFKSVINRLRETPTDYNIDLIKYIYNTYIIEYVDGSDLDLVFRLFAHKTFKYQQLIQMFKSFFNNNIDEKIIRDFAKQFKH